MRLRVMLTLAALAVLPGCETPTPEHIAYCQAGGFWGCGHGTRLMGAGLTGMAIGNSLRNPAPVYVVQQPVYAAPLPPAPPVVCQTNRFGTTSTTTCR